MERQSADSKVIAYWRPVDWMLETAAGLGVLANLAIVIYHYGSLPEVIPRHFNAAGEPDGFSNKWIIWLLPLLTIALYAGLTWLGKMIHRSRSSAQASADKASLYSQLTARLIRWMKLGVVVLFGYLTWGTIRIALDKSEQLCPWLLPIVVIAFLVLLSWYIIKYKKLGSQYPY